MKTITAYRCGHCPTAKITVTERSMTRHESDCIYNPEVKACPTCAHDGIHQCLAGWLPDGERLIRRCEHHVHGVAA